MPLVKGTRQTYSHKHSSFACTPFEAAMAEWVWLHLMQVVEPLGHAHSHLHSTHPVRPRSARLLSPGKLVLKGEEGQRKGGAGRGRAGRGRGGERERRGEGGAREREGRGEGGAREREGGRGRGQEGRGAGRGKGRERTDTHEKQHNTPYTCMHTHTSLPLPPLHSPAGLPGTSPPQTVTPRTHAGWGHV